MRPSATPTMLLPGPMPASSSSRTRCRMPPGRVGSTVSANRVFRVLAGGSLRCASCAASTSPLRASATSHDRAETSGSAGVPGRGRTSVPCPYSTDGRGITALGPPAGPGFGAAAAAPGANTRTPATQTAQVAAAARGMRKATAVRGIRKENPMVISST
ncbi:hypothetical protein AS200_39490 [Streptomyces sp. CdTB01]|nr:hypothetical protein AS200_39490 [Streptomyces sp. CdTB01]